MILFDLHKEKLFDVILHKHQESEHKLINLY